MDPSRPTDCTPAGDKVRIDAPDTPHCIYFHSIHRASRWMDHMYAKIGMVSRGTPVSYRRAFMFVW